MVTTVFVTGAGGFVGRNLVPELIEKDYSVVAFDIIHLQGILPENTNCIFKQGDITNKKELKKAIKNCQVVIHLAGVIGSSDYQKNYQIHVEGTKNLIAACKNNKIQRIIAYSSIAAAKEKTGSYGATKKELEQLFLKEKNLNTTILRPTMILGYKGKGIDTIVKQIKSYPLFIPVIGNAQRHPIWIKDIARLTIGLLENENSFGKTYDVGGEESISFKDFVKMTRKELGVKKITLPLPLFLAKTLARLMEKYTKKPLFTYENVCNLAMDENIDINALKEIGFQSTPLSQSLPEVLKEYK